MQSMISEIVLINRLSRKKTIAKLGINPNRLIRTHSTKFDPIARSE